MSTISSNNNRRLEYAVFQEPGGRKKVARVVSTLETRPNYAEVLNLTTFVNPKGRRKPKSNEFADLDDTIMLRPPHTQEAKAAVANAHESDPYLKNMTMYYTQYIFGDQIKPRLIPLQVDTPESRVEADDLVDEIIGKKKRKDFMNFIAKVDEISQIWTTAKLLSNQSWVFGTSAGWKRLALKPFINKKRGVNIPVNTPIGIEMLDGYYLANLFVNMKNNKPKFLEYKSPQWALDENTNSDGERILELTRIPDTNYRITQNLLPFDRLLIFRRPNIGTTPDTHHFGISPLLPALYVSENIRRIDEKILPEINEGQYAPIGIFRVQEDSKYDLDQLAQDLSQAGTKIVVNESVEFIPVDMKYDIAGLLLQKDNLIKSELMALGIPSPLFNFEEITNRSTMEIIINVWQNIRLQDERETLKNTMWNYWYKDLMKVFFQGEEYIDLVLKVDLEFTNKSFTAFIDKAEQLLNWHLAGLITKKEARVNIDFPPYDEMDEEHTKAKKKEEEAEAKKQMDMQLTLQAKTQQQKLRTVETQKRVDNKTGMVKANTSNNTPKKPVPKK